MSAAYSDRYVCLRGGLSLPIDPLQLLLNLEARGFQLEPKNNGQIWIRPFSQLTDDDTAVLRRWRHHLHALMNYRVPLEGSMTVRLTNSATVATMTTIASGTTNTQLRPRDRVERIVDGRLCSQRVLEFCTASGASNGGESRWWASARTDASDTPASVAKAIDGA